MRASDLREKNDTELKAMIRQKQDDLMHFRLQMATGVVDNVKLSRNTRRDIARIHTILNERARTAAGA